MRPQVKDYSVSGRDQFGDFFCLIRRYIEHLYSASCNLLFVVAPVFVPVGKRDRSVAGNGFRDDVLNLLQAGIGIRGSEN